MLFFCLDDAHCRRPPSPAVTLPTVTTELLLRAEKQRKSRPQLHKQPIAEAQLSLGGVKVPRRGASKQRGRRAIREGGEEKY